jgi:hypothetical protein
MVDRGRGWNFGHDMDSEESELNPNRSYTDDKIVRTRGR